MKFAAKNDVASSLNVPFSSCFFNQKMLLYFEHLDGGVEKMIRWLKGVIAMYQGLPREMYVLFIARVINRLGGFVNTFLLLFLRENMHMTLERAGLFISTAGVASLLGTFIGGHLGDSLGRKKTYVAAQSISAALFIPCGFLGTSGIIPILLIASSFFSSIVQPINSALVSDLVAKEDRKRAFSLLYFGINLGVAIGPIIAGYLFYHSIQWIFWGDAFTTFIAVILIIKYIPETKLTHEEIKEISETLSDAEKMETGSAVRAFLKRPILIAFTFFSALTHFVYAQSSFALPATMTDLFGKIGAIYFGNLMSFNAVIVVVFTILVTKVTDKNRPIFNIAFSNLLYCIGFGMMAFVHSMPLILLSVYLWTMGEILGVTNTGVFIANNTPITHRSRFNAIISILGSLGHMLGPIVGGILVVHYSMNNLWVLTGVLSLVAFFGLMAIGLFERYKSQSIVGKYTNI